MDSTFSRSGHLHFEEIFWCLKIPRKVANPPAPPKQVLLVALEGHGKPKVYLRLDRQTGQNRSLGCRPAVPGVVRSNLHSDS
jgi:hypothetical protein